MISIPLPFRDASLELASPVPGLPAWAFATGIVALLVVAFVLLIYLYRLELRHISRLRALALLSIRFAIVAVILLVLVADPKVQRTSREPQQCRVIVAMDTSESTRITDPERPAEQKAQLTKLLNLSDHDAINRLELCDRILARDGLNLLARLNGQYRVELFRFDEDAVALPIDDAQRKKTLETSSSKLTDTKLPLQRALDLSSDSSRTASPVVGMLLFTDGRQTFGESARTLIPTLVARNIPIYPVIVAPTKPPPDIAITSARAQSSLVFQGSAIPVEINIRATSWPAGTITVKMELLSNQSISTTIQHDGEDRNYPLLMKAKLDAEGSQTLTITAESKDRVDRFPRNNARHIRVTVVKEKARVMLVDGESRWEFHYLHTCLGRDENMDVRSVVFRQPRITETSDEELRKAGFPARKMPADADALNQYDAIVLGDVEREQFDRVEKQRIERYVAEAGGTLVIVAGKHAMPLEMIGNNDDDPIRRLLPIRDPKVFENKNGFRVSPTAEGLQMWFMQLADTATDNQSRWDRLPKHYWAITGVLKPGAEVLASANDQPIIVRQNYGFGRVLYVGIDSTWRWRFQVGDVYHHRLWGQLAQWAASDRILPSSNPSGTIRFGTREPTFRPNQTVELIVRASDTIAKLDAKARKSARLIRLPAKPGELEKPASVVSLATKEGKPNELTAEFRHLTPGKYAIELDVPDWAEHLPRLVRPDGVRVPLRAGFEVLPNPDEELLDLTADREFLEELANATGGEVHTPETVERVLTQLGNRVGELELRTERYARRSWWILGLLVGLLTLEWALRKWIGLP